MLPKLFDVKQVCTMHIWMFQFAWKDSVEQAEERNVGIGETMNQDILETKHGFQLICVWYVFFDVTVLKSI